MSTHAVVAVMHGEVCKSIYVHSDGYPEYLGAVLNKYYDSTKANFLVAQGDCSMVGIDIGEKINFDDRLTFVKDAELNLSVATQCRFYKRDRDEENVEFLVSHSFNELTDKYGLEYYYIMRDGEWFVSINGRTLQSLANMVSEQVEA